jgi:murein DD-endopeptidase MepM/ murein hydrolase activator NlpD
MWPMRKATISTLMVISICYLAGTNMERAQAKVFGKGYDIEKTGLTPVYPEGLSCSPLTSLYASWIDVDGTRRDEIHSGVDGGRLGEPVLAPAGGQVRAAWQADWGWGNEGALLIRHSRADLNLKDSAPYYYSEFDHLLWKDVKLFDKGDTIERGQRLASVSRPGGHSRYLPEVHWEVWELTDDSATTWHANKFGGRYWTNSTARLIDPLYMLNRQVLPNNDGGVQIKPYSPSNDWTSFKGFSYILPCVPDEPSHAQQN